VYNDLVPSAPAYWQLNEQTAEGQLKKATLGNGITTEYTYVPQTGAIDAIRSRNGSFGPYAIQNFEYDFNALGFLKERRDINLSVSGTGSASEKLVNADSYDALNRVKTVRRYLDGTLQTNGTKTVNYDALGNITSKSHLVGTTTGTYDYTTAATCTGVTGAVPSGPHAVRRVTVGSDTRDFCYDANGNQLRGWNFAASPNRPRDMTWTSYNYPKTVKEASQTITFSYGADRSRFRQINEFNGKTTIYVDGIYERETLGATTTHVHYVFAGGQAVAIYKSRSDSTQETLYPHRDHLGSVTSVTDANQGIVDTLSYDMWGKRRNPNWTDAGSLVFGLKTPRGYTGHEHLDDTGLIHMNARSYDPTLARMLSADPFVQFPGSSQSYNRFSYVLNSPLTYTDPSGFCIDAGACPAGGLAPFVPGLGGAPPGRALGGGSAGRVSVIGVVARVVRGIPSPSFTFGLDTNPAPWDCFFIDSDYGRSSPFSFSFSYPTSRVVYYPVMYTYSTPPAHAPAASAAADGQPFLSKLWGRVTAAKSSMLEAASGMSTLEKVHLGLNALSMAADATGVGASVSWIFDVADGIVSAAEGDWKGAAMSIGAAVPGLGNAANAAKIARTLCCFAEGTLVATEDGPVPIEEIKVGDKVWARSEETGETALKPVVDLIRRTDRQIWELTYEVHEPSGYGSSTKSEVFETTNDHPWARIDGEWVATQDLRPGMQIIRQDGAPATVVSVVETDRTMPTYNLEVADFHTYFVGESRVWVHNGGPVCDLATKSDLVTKRPGTRGHPDHQRDVAGGGRQQAERQAGPGETVVSEGRVQGHPGVNRRADNQVIGEDGKTRLVVESERRPNGPYHQNRTKQLEGVGIEVQTRPPSDWTK
jgi:RHS repeat-associated protein